MSEEIQQAIQIIRIAYDGIEIVMKVMAGSVEQMKKAVSFLIAMVDNEKMIGKTDVRKLLMKGGDLQVFQFKTEDLKQVKKMAKKYGILYSILPNINKEDGNREIIFHSEAVPRVNMMIQKLKLGKIVTFDDYLKNGNENEVNKVVSFLGKQKNNKKENKFSQNDPEKEAIKVENLLDGLMEKVGMLAAERSSIGENEIKENFKIKTEQAQMVINQLEKIGMLSKVENGQYKILMNKEDFSNHIRKYKELVERIQSISRAQNPNLVDITITKNQIAKENDHAIKIRVPKIEGDTIRYLWIDKQKVMESHNGQAIFTFLDKNKDYKLYSADNKVMDIIKGDTLYDSYYDSVSIEIGKHDQELKNKSIAVKKKTPAPKTR